LLLLADFIKGCSTCEASDEQTEESHLPVIKHRRPGPKQPNYRIPREHWPVIMLRVVENNESLRQVADEYGVSGETIHCIMLHAHKQRGQQEA